MTKSSLTASLPLYQKKVYALAGRGVAVSDPLGGEQTVTSVTATVTVGIFSVSLRKTVCVLEHSVTELTAVIV